MKKLKSGYVSTSYDKYIVFFSGGKDSIACVLNLLEQGIPAHKIELWHHDIDGREGSTLMDWTCTRSYCAAFAKAFGLQIFFSWREGGFEREMLRNNSHTGGVYFEDPIEGLVYLAASQQDRYKNTRLRYPQITANLSSRWCSAYLKIDVAGRAINNCKRLKGLRVLTISGERGQESSARAKYKKLEIDRSDCRRSPKKENRRWVTRARPILDWMENQVWEIIQRWGVRVHPAYYLGYSRTSCFDCIFGDADQFATGQFIYPYKTNQIIEYEKSFDMTLKRDISLIELIKKGTVYPATIEPNNEHLVDARNEDYTQTIIMKIEDWYLPAGAYKNGACGAA